MVRVAVIGIGSMGRNHARIYRELDQSELVAVCDAELSLAASIAESSAVPAYSDLHRMLEETMPEAVSIAVPTAFHEQVALAALEAGCHVLIEKPITATLEEGQEIIDTLPKSGAEIDGWAYRPLQSGYSGIETQASRGRAWTHIPNRLPAGGTFPGAHPRCGSCD